MWPDPVIVYEPSGVAYIATALPRQTRALLLRSKIRIKTILINAQFKRIRPNNTVIKFKKKDFNISAKSF